MSYRFRSQHLRLRSEDLVLKVKILSTLGIRDWIQVSSQKGMNVKTGIGKQETN